MEDEILDTQDTAPTMDETIAATLADIQARDSQPDEETEVVDETPEETEQRARDEKGRFAAKQAEESPLEPVIETPAEPVVEEPLAVEVQRLGLRKEEVAAWKEANPVLQQALLRRSEEMHRGLEQYRGAAQFANTMAEAFRPYEQTLQQLGLAPDVAVGKLLQVDSALRHGNAQQKAATIASLVQQYGVDMNEVANIPPPDPQYNALQNQVAQLQGFISNFQRTQAEQQEATLNSELATFAQGREHFQTVREDMAALLQAGRATDLNDAYEKAIWANPSVRTALLAKQQAEASEKIERERKALDAKRAASVNVPRRGSVPAGASVGTMDDTIRAAARKLGVIS